MPFRPYHTGLKQAVDFEPLNAEQVTIYNCGPTVYGTPHIGNFRSFIFADVLRKYLEWRGYTVVQIMNITDVGHLTEDDRADAEGEDKLQKKAEELGWDAFKVARHYEDEFHTQRRVLGIADAHEYPRATDHIAEMLAQIQQLIDRGHAYIPEGSGEVYYDIASFPDYGWLSGKRLEDLIAGARVEVNDKKKNPADFALWKTDAAHLMQWDPHADRTWERYQGTRPTLDQRIGKGFPGWHIECSAMSAKYLGDTIDIHTGGEDNIFPHHECEIAQAVGATGKAFVRTWMHARHLLVDNKKMSKSAGTLYTLEDLTAKGYTPREVRYLMVSNHYRQPMNFTMDGLEAARAAVARLQTTADLLAERASSDTSTVSEDAVNLIAKLEDDFRDAMDDDLNASNAMAAVFHFAHEVNREGFSGADARACLAALARIDHVLGVLSERRQGGLIRTADLDSRATTVQADAEAILGRESYAAAEIETLILARHAARKSKNWALADTIRDQLKHSRVMIEDTAEGVRYRLPDSPPGN